MTTWNPPPSPLEPPTVDLTERQADVLAGLCRGESNAEIGARLFISENSVKTTVKRVFSKLGARNRWHAVAIACSRQVHITVTESYRRAA